MGHWMRFGTRGLGRRVLAGVVVLACPATASAATNEFRNPSQTKLPAVSAANTTPSCSLTEANDYQCDLPASSLPPRDAGNPETYLNSAYWPAEKRPDIEMDAIQRYGYSYKNCYQKLQHYCFLADAVAVHYPVTHKPKVGDLWLAPGECLGFGGSGAPLQTGCSDNENDWYLGYVEHVFPDGSFIQSWGGSDTPADSGLGETRFSGAMDPYTDFIGLMPGPACVVPRLTHLTLSQARRALSSAHCAMGTVHQPKVKPHHTLRVSRQSASTRSKHSAGYKVRITLS
jgi:hypothetical protein